MKMQFLKIKLIGIVLFFVSFEGNAQAPKSFSGDPAAFFKESVIIPVNGKAIPVLMVSPKLFSIGFTASPVMGLIAYPPEVFKVTERGSGYKEIFSLSTCSVFALQAYRKRSSIKYFR